MKFPQQSISGPGDCQENWEFLQSQGDNAWHYVGATGEPAFKAGWANLGGTNTAVSFRKFADGTVRLRGIATSPANPTVAFTLPLSYTPYNTPGATDTLRFNAVSNQGGAWIEVYCRTTTGVGDVLQNGVTAGGGGWANPGAGWVDFSSISFSILP